MGTPLHHRYGSATAGRLPTRHHQRVLASEKPESVDHSQNSHAQFLLPQFSRPDSSGEGLPQQFGVVLRLNYRVLFDVSKGKEHISVL